MSLLKNALLLLPPVRRYVEQARQMRAELAARNQQVTELKTLLGATRSPALCSSVSDHLTDRLLAHPVLRPMSHLKLESQGATSAPDRVAHASRLLDAYHLAVADEAASRLKRDGEDLWSGLIRKELPELMEIIDARDPARLADYLMNFGKTFVWFGGITTCIDGYNKNLDPSHIALTYLDKLVCLAEYLGVIRYENPEAGPWGENLVADAGSLVKAIESELGIDIGAPVGVIHTDGIRAGDTLLHYRHINALYSAIRVHELAGAGAACCEIGGGLGITAMYARRLGVLDYTIYDLPITCLLAGHYLLNACGSDAVCLHGESPSTDAIKLLPYWSLQNAPDQRFCLSLNQDSLPEIADNLVHEYLAQIKRTTTRYFLSINHEYFFPRTVHRFVSESGGLSRVHRARYWIREGYLEELFSIDTRV